MKYNIMIVVTTQKCAKIKEFPMCTKTSYNKNIFTHKSNHTTTVISNTTTKYVIK